MPPVLLFSFMPEMDRAMEECRREMIRKDTALPVIVFWHMAILLCLWLSLGAGITASAAENGPEQENGAEHVDQVLHRRAFGTEYGKGKCGTDNGESCQKGGRDHSSGV